jgi:hypothetical protein
MELAYSLDSVHTGHIKCDLEPHNICSPSGSTSKHRMVILEVRTSTEPFTCFINSTVIRTRMHSYSAVFTIRHILCFGLTSFLDACLTSETKFLVPYQNPWLCGTASFSSCHWILLVGLRGYYIEARTHAFVPCL